MVASDTPDSDRLGWPVCYQERKRFLTVRQPCLARPMIAEFRGPGAPPVELAPSTRRNPGGRPADRVLVRNRHGEVGTMGLIIALLVLWVVLAVIGFAVKSLLWLAIIGIVLFIATGVFGGIRRRTLR
jgi:hypothetical protein